MTIGQRDAGGVNVNASPGGSLISSNLSLVNHASDGTLTFNVAHNASAPYDLLVSGAISTTPAGLAGTAVIKAGPGLMVMSGANTYVGPTTVTAGTLQIGNGGSGEALSSGSISVSSGAVLAFNQTDALTISPSAGISGGGALVKFGSGTVVLGSTNNAYTGGTTVNAGVLTATNSGALPGFASAGSVSVASGAAVAVSMSGWSQGDIDSLRTSAADSRRRLPRTGHDRRERHVFQCDPQHWVRRRGRTGEARREHPLPHQRRQFLHRRHAVGRRHAQLRQRRPAFVSPSIAFNGGTLQWASGNTEDISSGLAAIPSGQTANFDTNGNNVAFAAGVSGSGGVNKLGGGALILAGSNTYSGATTITAGTLQVGNGGAGEGFASPSVGGAGTMAFNIGGSFTYSRHAQQQRRPCQERRRPTHLEFREQRLDRHDRSRRRHAQRRRHGVLSTTGIFNSGTRRTWQVDSAQS